MGQICPTHGSPTRHQIRVGFVQRARPTQWLVPFCICQCSASAAEAEAAMGEGRHANVAWLDLRHSQSGNKSWLNDWLTSGFGCVWPEASPTSSLARQLTPGPPTVYRLLCVNNVTNVVSASRTQTSPEIHPYAIVFTSLMEQWKTPSNWRENR